MTYLSIHFHINTSMYVCRFLSITLRKTIYVYLSVCLSIYLSIHRWACMHVYRHTCTNTQFILMYVDVHIMYISLQIQTMYTY